jgi:hypothetical protein
MSKKSSSSKEKSSKFVLEKIDITKLEKNHVMSEDMLMSSLRNSPKSKMTTKIKDIFKNSEKEFAVKEKKDHIKEFENVRFYISMNGKMIDKRDLEDKPIKCFHCHKSLNYIPLTVPIKYHESTIESYMVRTNKLFEDEDSKDDNKIKTISKCFGKKDRQHPQAIIRDYFEGIGVVCSFECALPHAKMRYLCGDARFKESYTLIAKMYYMTYKKYMPVLKQNPYFCYELLDEYGGMCKEIPPNLKEVKTTYANINETNVPKFTISGNIYEEIKQNK